ncbi:MAG: TROVE domain-containing protein [Deltaproteobacteria bacterium]|nr:TROVE domain-containing protein [Deltaproteobacteria bacterium]
MANKNLFARASKAKAADVINEAGGRAYAFSAEHALAQYAATGTFNTTYYATADEQLDKVLELAALVEPAFLAKTAVFARERGYMKDLPAFLAAVLASKDVNLLAAVFPRVIDNAKMLRNFTQIVRSGVTGRKSFGSAPKRLARAWFASRSAENVFRASVGNDPSLADVIKLVRPVPKNEKGETDVMRQALYGWLIGREVEETALPPLVRAFEAFKKGESKDLPDVPFEMLTALPLDASAWKRIAKNMTWTQLRMNLNTLARHGVFEDSALVAHVAQKLGDATQVRRAKAFPYQLMMAFKASDAGVPDAITNALQKAMEVATENVPEVNGKVYICPDVSGSMHSPVTGHRRGSTTAVRCIDVAALVAASFVRKNPPSDGPRSGRGAEVIPFSDDVVPLPRRLNPYDSVLTNADFLAKLPSGGTACSAPLKKLNAEKAKGDLVVYVSDNMSWADFGLGFHRVGRGRATEMANQWVRFKERNPRAKLVLIDLQPYASTQVHDDEDVLNVGGFSDRVFEIVSLFAKGELGASHWVDVIRAIELISA